MRAVLIFLVTVVAWLYGMQVVSERIRFALDDWWGQTLACQASCERKGYRYGAVRVDWVGFSGDPQCECVGYRDDEPDNEGPEPFEAR